MSGRGEHPPGPAGTQIASPTRRAGVPKQVHVTMFGATVTMRMVIELGTRAWIENIVLRIMIEFDQWLSGAPVLLQRAMNLRRGREGGNTSARVGEQAGQLPVAR